MYGRSILPFVSQLESQVTQKLAFCLNHQEAGILRGYSSQKSLNKCKNTEQEIFYKRTCPVTNIWEGRKSIGGHMRCITHPFCLTFHAPSVRVRCSLIPRIPSLAVLADGWIVMQFPVSCCLQWLHYELDMRCIVQAGFVLLFSLGWLPPGTSTLPTSWGLKHVF